MKLKVLLFLLSTSIGLLPCTNATVITSTEILDLELISRNTGEVGGVLPVIDRTITQAGKERFATILCNPITDIKILQARQQLIQSMQNPAFAAKIRQQLETIKKHEPMLRLCFDPTYREQFSAALEKSYYKLEALQKLNKSPLALDAAHIVEFIALFEPVLHHALLHAGLDFITGEHSCGSCAGHNHNHDHSADHQTCSHAHDDNKFANFMRESALGKLLQNTLIYGHGAMTLLNVKEMAEHLYYKSGIINVIHQELISVNACIKACATIGDIFKNDLINHAHIDADILPLLCDDYTELVAQSFDGTFQDTEENYLGLF
ncbi:hypothetical protein FJ364_03280, partial [Candidatus Dependentiae bacterium]|nr:hypothetical protein [Candidatus Dependentiae bacterium]